MGVVRLLVGCSRGAAARVGAVGAGRDHVEAVNEFGGCLRGQKSGDLLLMFDKSMSAADNDEAERPGHGRAVLRQATGPLRRGVGRHALGQRGHLRRHLRAGPAVDRARRLGDAADPDRHRGSGDGDRRRPDRLLERAERGALGTGPAHDRRPAAALPGHRLVHRRRVQPVPPRRELPRPRDGARPRSSPRVSTCGSDPDAARGPRPGHRGPVSTAGPRRPAPRGQVTMFAIGFTLDEAKAEQDGTFTTLTRVATGVDGCGAVKHPGSVTMASDIDSLLTAFEDLLRPGAEPDEQAGLRPDHRRDQLRARVRARPLDHQGAHPGLVRRRRRSGLGHRSRPTGGPTRPRRHLGRRRDQLRVAVRQDPDHRPGQPGRQRRGMDRALAAALRLRAVRRREVQRPDLHLGQPGPGLARGGHHAALHR